MQSPAQICWSLKAEAEAEAEAEAYADSKERRGCSYWTGLRDGFKAGAKKKKVKRNSKEND